MSSAESESEAPAMTAAEMANFKTLMKATEELVTKARLDQIARDHKSIGAILDDRVLYKIEEPMKRSKSQTFKTALQLQREKELHEEELEKEAQQEKMMVHAAKLLKKQSDYSTEQQIWKEKSGPAVYSQARRFQFPELQKFKESLTHEQQVVFKRRTNAALMALADKYREECRELKVEMDLNGVFHPDANAHRVHCIYLMKLYKGIRSDTIEDPILRQMKLEEEKRVAHLKALAEQKQELLRSMEAADFANMTPSQQEAVLAAAEAKKREEEGADEKGEDGEDKQPQDTASLDTGSIEQTVNNTAANSVATSLNLSVNITATTTPKASTGPTPVNSKGNSVKFARFGSMKSVVSSSEKTVDTEKSDSDKILPDVGSAKSQGTPKILKTPKSALSTPKSSLSRGNSGRDRAESSESTILGIAAQTGSKKIQRMGSSATPKAMHKSASAPAVSSSGLSVSISNNNNNSGGDGGDGSNPPSAGAAFSSSGASSKLPPIQEPGSVAAPPAHGTEARTMAGARRTSHSKSASAITPSGRRRVMSGMSEDLAEHSSMASTDRHSSPEKERNPAAKANDKLFKRIKANKLGGAEPRTLLTDEASKLEVAESFSMKKTRDKNSILETEMTDWMLSSVQKAQIGKTSVGAAMLTTGGISNSFRMPSSSIVTEFNDAIKRTGGSPTRMIPFDQFHTMFEEYSKIHGPPSPKAQDAAPLSQVGSGAPASKSVDVSGSAGKRQRRRRQTEGSNEGGSLSSSLHEEDSHRSRLSHLDVSNPNHVEPTNLVKTLAEQDANFEAYLKVAQHQERANESDSQNKMRNRLNASITAPRRMRKPNPLGQSAVNLLDSRGRASRASTKGFGNIFQAKSGSEDPSVGDDFTAESADGQKKSKKDGIRIDAHVSIMGTDNIMGRLSRLDEDDMSHNTNSSFDVNGSVGSPGSHNGSRTSSPRSTTARPNTDNALGTTISPDSKDKEKERFRSSRQSSRSRRRLQSSDSFRDGSSGKGSGKGPLLSTDKDDDDEGAIADPSPDQGMQDKLVAAWDCLQMPAAQRFGFMQKYSGDEYSMEMGRAVDIWAESALLVMSIVEINKLIGKIKAGTCVLPLTRNTLLRNIRSRIPPLLASSASFFVPPSLGYYDAQISQQSVPLSAEALNKVYKIVEEGFRQYGEPLEGRGGGSGVFEINACQTMLTDMLGEAAVLLKRSLKFAYTELNDVIPYGAKGCKEWIFALAGMGIKTNSSNTHLSAAGGVGGAGGSFDEFDAI